MAKLEKNSERLKNRHWLKALQLAKLLFEDEGYFTDYLEQVEDFVKNNHAKINDAVVEFSIKNQEIIRVDHRHFKDYYRRFTNDDIAQLSVRTDTGCLRYTSNIGKYFSLEEIRLIVCFNKRQIICKLRSVPGKVEGQTSG